MDLSKLNKADLIELVESLLAQKTGYSVPGMGEANMARLKAQLEAATQDDKTEVVDGVNVPTGFADRLNEVWNDGWRPPVDED